MKSIYQNKTCYIASMHKKQAAIKKPFEKHLGCKVVPIDINTDLFGTFTGEIERTLSPLETAKQKCIKGLKTINKTVGISNEGSFIPHPHFPFITADLEILFFIDLDLNFELSLKKIFLETNYSAKSVTTIQELEAFAIKSLFPSHGLILRPNDIKEPEFTFKGIQDRKHLHTIFQTCMQNSKEKSVWVETDMRAHMNPTRMKKIQELSYDMAKRLKTLCPSCESPGFGISKTLQGLPCAICETPTELIKSKIYKCVHCPYEKTLENKNGLASPGFCPFCNP